jgi:pyrroloquinoline quinone biosynthesis protein E
LHGIYVSLNGPTAETNQITRDGYDYAISALEVLKNSGFSNTNINWVMHRQTADTLPQMLALAEKYNVKAIVIMQPKPTSSHELNTLPTKEQMYAVADMVRANKSSVALMVESCFSPMLALVGRNAFFGNINRGVSKGCLAGRIMFSVNVEGYFSPCRHLEFFEKHNSVSDYWNNSPFLETLRGLEEQKREPCADCTYGAFCRHCLAINSKIHNDVYIGNEFCAIYEKKQ